MYCSGRKVRAKFALHTAILSAAAAAPDNDDATPQRNEPRNKNAKEWMKNRRKGGKTATRNKTWAKPVHIQTLGVYFFHVFSGWWFCCWLLCRFCFCSLSSFYSHFLLYCSQCFFVLFLVRETSKCFCWDSVKLVWLYPVPAYRRVPPISLFSLRFLGPLNLHTSFAINSNSTIYYFFLPFFGACIRMKYKERTKKKCFAQRISTTWPTFYVSIQNPTHSCKYKWNEKTMQRRWRWNIG